MMKIRLTAFLVCASLFLTALAVPMLASSQTWVVDASVGYAEVNTSNTFNTYTAQWQYWCQGASQYQRLRDYGCRVVAQAKLLVECGAAPRDTALFNPDIFLDWAVPLGYWFDDPDNMLERTKTGLPSIRYASEQGMTLTQTKYALSGRNSDADAELVMSCIRAGYYVILSGPGHQAYVGREASLDADMPIILDSWNTVTSASSSCCAYRGYTIAYFTELYCYSTDGQPAERPAAVTRELTVSQPVLSGAPDRSIPVSDPEPDEPQDEVEIPETVESPETIETVYNHLDRFQRSATYFGQFTDVAPDSWYYPGVSTAYELGLIRGVSEDQFDAYRSMTLAEVLTIVCRLHSIYYTGSAFTPTFSNPWYIPYFEYAVENGIIANVSVDLTRPATRAEFAALFSRALPDEALTPINLVEEGAIPDVPTNAMYAPEIYRLYRAGIVIGSDQSGSFRPDSTISRAEAATIVTRVADVSLRRSVYLPAWH